MGSRRPSGDVPPTRVVIALATLVSLVTAGCVEPPRDPPGPPAGATAIPPPEWREGDAFNYSLQDADGAVIGWRQWLVLGRDVVDGSDVHAVLETSWTSKSFDHGTSQSPPSNRTRYYDVRTMNEVWDRCALPTTMGKCAGRARALDFPLWDGKSWEWETGGDVANTMKSDARSATNGTVIVTQRCAECGNGRAAWAYDPARGVITAFTMWDADGNAHEDALRLTNVTRGSA